MLRSGRRIPSRLPSRTPSRRSCGGFVNASHRSRERPASDSPQPAGGLSRVHGMEKLLVGREGARCACPRTHMRRLEGWTITFIPLAVSCSTCSGHSGALRSHLLYTSRTRPIVPGCPDIHRAGVLARDAHPRTAAPSSIERGYCSSDCRNLSHWNSLPAGAVCPDAAAADVGVL